MPKSKETQQTSRATSFSSILPWGMDKFLTSLSDIDDIWKVFDSVKTHESYPLDEYWDDKRNFHIEVPLAGYRREDILLEVEGDMLHLHATRQSKKDAATKSTQRDVIFKWRLTDESEPAQIASSFKDGLLTITIPSKKVEDKTPSKFSVSIS